MQLRRYLTNLGGIVSTSTDFSVPNSLSTFLTSCSDIVKKEQVEFFGGFNVLFCMSYTGMIFIMANDMIYDFNIIC